MKFLVLVSLLVSFNAMAGFTERSVQCKSQNAEITVEGFSFRGNIFFQKGVFKYKGEEALLPENMEGSFTDHTFYVHLGGRRLQLDTYGFMFNEFIVTNLDNTEGTEIGKCTSY